jgi:hypothetical protein
MKFLRVLLLTVSLLFVMQPSRAANKNHEKAEKATFVLYGHSDARGIDHVALCTAFVYKKAPDGYFLMTAGHCFISEAPEDAVYLVGSGQIVDNPTGLQPVEVLNHVDDGKMDVAELHLKTSKKYPVLELDDRPVQIDDRVFYVGYPEMVSQVVYTGRVGSVYMQTERSSCEGICKGRFLVQTGGGGGASGSPVISDKTGKVVGVLEGHLFENGVVVVPTTAIHLYYLKEGHVQLKNARSETGAVQ